MDKYLEYSFTEGGDSGMDSRDFIAAHFLAQLPKLLTQAIEYDDYRGVLVLAKSMQEFSSDWLYSYGLDSYGDNEKLGRIWLQFIYALQKAIWEACVYLDSWSEVGDMREEFEAMVLLYQKYTQSDSDILPTKTPEIKLWKAHLLNSEVSILDYLNENKNVDVGKIKNQQNFLQAKIIAKILSLWQSNDINITFEAYTDISKIIIEITKSDLDGDLNDAWTEWYNQFKSPSFSYTYVKNSGDLIWVQTIDSLKKDWREFGKEKFVVMEIDIDSLGQQSNLEEIKPQHLDNSSKQYQAIQRPTKLRPDSGLNRDESIVITGKFGIEREELESVLKFNGFSVKNDPSDDLDYILVGFKPGSKLEKAKNFEIKEIDFLDLIKLLVIQENDSID